MARCLVTGATGYIGGELCRRLAASGAEVVALARQPGEVAGTIATLQMDLAQSVPSARQLRDVDFVFHLAGIAHQRAAAEDYQRVNYQATLELARAAAAAGVGNFLFVSSVKAMGEPAGDQPRSEEDLATPRDAYGRSKRDAEQALVAEFSGGSMAVVILRPALVYGGGATGNLGALAAAAERGLPAPPERGARSMLGRDDLVELLLGFLEHPSTGVNTYNACDGQAYSSRRIYRALLAARGRKAPRGAMPLWLWRLACALLDLSGHLDSAGSYQRLFGTELYDASRLRAERNWQPQYTLEKSLGLSGNAP